MRNKTYATLTDLRSIKIRKTEDGRAKQQSVDFLKMLFGQVGGREVGVRLWDGTLWPDDAPRQVALELKHPHALNAMFHDGTELALAEAYMFNDFDIVGDIERVFGLSSALAATTAGWRKKLQAAMMLRQMPRPPKHSEGRRGPAHLKGIPHSVERDRQAVAYHYNLSNDFYELWLGRNMVYSCGYFRSLDQDIDTAQRQKLDYVCRKLRLRPGQRLLDIGCGWGGPGDSCRYALRCGSYGCYAFAGTSRFCRRSNFRGKTF